MPREVDMNKLFFFLFFIFTPALALSLDVTPDALAGKWTFTHMILDGEQTRRVNKKMEFLPEGEVINFNKDGSEKSRATYTISDSTIVYTDKRGAQPWKIQKFDGKSLHVNHKGADMFFRKDS